MENLGDIDRQTIAGAISTGTHGTGARLRNISAQVEAIELVLADGSVRELGADADPELLRAARVGVGALGAISAVTLRCVPAFTLRPGRRAAPARGGARRLRRARRRATTTSSSSPSPTPTRRWCSSATAPTSRRGRAGRAAAYLNDVVLENWALEALLGDRQGAARGRSRRSRGSPAGSPRGSRASRPQRPRLRQRAPGPLHRDGVRAAARARAGGGAAGDRVGARATATRSSSRSRCGSPPATTPCSAPPTSATPPTSPSTSTGGWSGAPTSRRSRRSWTTTAAAPTGASATSRPPRRWRRATRAGRDFQRARDELDPGRAFANEYADRVLGP